MFATQFLFAEAQHGAEGGIYEERLPIQVLHNNSDGACVKNIAEKPNVGWLGLRCLAHSQRVF